MLLYITYDRNEVNFMHKNDFAPTPPMGWDSYYYYGTSINETQVKSAAQFLTEHLKEYGWEYIIIGTKFLPDKDAFPSSVTGTGYKSLADYIHKLGLKFGIHISTIQASGPFTAEIQLLREDKHIMIPCWPDMLLGEWILFNVTLIFVK